MINEINELELNDSCKDLLILTKIEPNQCFIIEILKFLLELQSQDCKFLNHLGNFSILIIQMEELNDSN